MENENSAPRPKRRMGSAVALMAAGVVAGGVLAATFSASAATSSNTSSGTSSGGYSATAPAPRGMHDRSATPVRSDEQALSSADAAKVRAAALAAVPGGTVYRVETDAGDGVYEAHMTKSDGTPVTVKVDKNFKVTAVEAGMGTGDPAPAGAPAGPGSPTGTSGASA